jgi:predicted MFS family arabinose efflux permease
MEGERPDSAFTWAETERGLKFGIVDGIFANAMFTLCSGAILAALALFAGMSDFSYGILAALPFLAQLLQLPAAILYRRFQNRKSVTIAFATAGRLSLLVIAAAVLVFPPEYRAAGIFAGMLGWSALTSVAGGSWLWWMRDLVPENRLGRYFGTRGALLVGLSAPVLLGAGFLLDHQRTVLGAEGERAAFGAIYITATLFGLGSSLFLSLMPHHLPREDPTSVPLRESFGAPFRDRNFRNLLTWLALWGFGATLAVPFFPIFLLVDHRMPIFIVTALLVVGTATNVVFYLLWGRLSDRHGNKPVMAVAVPVFAAGLLLTPFVPDGGVVELAAVVLIQVLFSIGTSAADLTSWNLAFKLARGPSTPAFLSGTLLVRALTTGTGPIVGGTIGGLFVATSVDLGLFRVSHLEFVFLLAAAVILASARPLSAVREVGEADRSDLLRALRAEVSGDALYPGVRHFALASSYLISAVVRGEELARGALAGGKRDQK